jgi:hypothetical protein
MVGVFYCAAVYRAGLFDRFHRAISLDGSDCHTQDPRPGFDPSGCQGVGNMTRPALPRSDPDRLAADGCRIRLSVERRFQRSGYAALSRVCCEFQRENGVLHLGGSVPSYYLKQVAQELVADLEGVRVVNNQINVARPAPLRGGSESGQSRSGGFVVRHLIGNNSDAGWSKR